MDLVRLIKKPEYYLNPVNLMRKLSGSSGKEGSVDLIWGHPSFSCNPKETIGRSLVSYRLYDLVLCESIKRLVGKESLCVDVGANIGVFTSLMSYQGGSVHSFEPHPRLFSLLEKNSSSLKNTKLHQKALSDIKGHFDLYIPKDFENNEGIASLQPIENSDLIKVETETLDNMFSNQSIDLLKVDVEGHELSVFKGGSQLLEEKKIKSLLFEEFGGSQAESILFLKDKGYQVYRLSKGFFQLQLLDPKDGDSLPLWEPANYLATVQSPEKLDGSFWSILL